MSVRIHICCADVREAQQLFSAFREVEHAHAAHVVDVECVQDWIVEIYAGSRVDNHIDLIQNDFRVPLRKTKTVLGKVASDRSDSLRPAFAHFRELNEVGLKDIRFEDLLQSLSIAHAFFGAHHDVKFAEIAERAHYFLQDNFADKARRSRYKNSLVRVKLLNPSRLR